MYFFSSPDILPLARSDRWYQKFKNVWKNLTLIPYKQKMSIKEKQINNKKKKEMRSKEPFCMDAPRSNLLLI